MCNPNHKRQKSQSQTQLSYLYFDLCMCICLFAYFLLYISFPICPCIVVPLLENLDHITSPIWREEAIDLSSSQLNMLEHLSHGPTPKLQIGNCVCNAHFDESSKLVALMTNSGSIKHEVLAARQRRIREADFEQTRKQNGKKKGASERGSYRPGGSTRSNGYTYHRRQPGGGYRTSTSQGTCST